MIKTSDIFSFLNSCKSRTTIDSIMNQFADFLETKFKDLNIAVLTADAIADPNSEFPRGAAGRSQKNSSIYKIYNPLQEARFILIAENVSVTKRNQIQILCDQLQSILQLFWPQENADEPNCADLVSFITHDINSLLTISKEQKGASPELLSKIVYMEKANTDLIFYIRELDIALVQIKISELMPAMISEISNPGKVIIKTSLTAADGLINVDMEHLNRAFQNIVQNALRAAQIQGGEVAIETISRKLCFEIIITDNGPGIPTEFVERIKKPFFTNYKAQGHSGFGLSIAEKIIHAHQGVLEVRNRNTDGVEAHIRLPVERTI